MRITPNWGVPKASDYAIANPPYGLPGFYPYASFIARVETSSTAIAGRTANETARIET